LIKLRSGKYKVTASFLKSKITAEFDVENLENPEGINLKIRSISDKVFKLKIETSISIDLKCDITYFQTILNQIDD